MCYICFERPIFATQTNSFSVNHSISLFEVLLVYLFEFTYIFQNFLYRRSNFYLHFLFVVGNLE